MLFGHFNWASKKKHYNRTLAVHEGWEPLGHVAPFDELRPDNRDMPVYHTVPRKSPVYTGFDLQLSAAFPQGSPLPEEETLSIELTCSNGTLPEGLHKRVAGIEEVTALPCERWVRGMPLAGREIRVKARKDQFGGSGDMYLFGCVLERFLAQCAEPNTFTLLTLEETLKGGVCQWPPRLGRKPLL